MAKIISLPCNADNLIALAQLYGVSLDTLLMGDEEPAKQEPEAENTASENSETAEENPLETPDAD